MNNRNGCKEKYPHLQMDEHCKLSNIQKEHVLRDTGLGEGVFLIYHNIVGRGVCVCDYITIVHF